MLFKSEYRRDVEACMRRLLGEQFRPLVKKLFHQYPNAARWLPMARQEGKNAVTAAIELLTLMFSRDLEENLNGATRREYDEYLAGSSSVPPDAYAQLLRRFLDEVE